MIDNLKAVRNLWQDPVGRTKLFFDRTPYYGISSRFTEPYQLGVYLYLWGEVYGFPENPKEIVATGRGTGKTSIFQELNAADMACFLPYFLQVFHHERKPVDVTIIFIANVKKGSKARLENVKTAITDNAYLERHLVDYRQWTKDRVVLKNGATLIAESASDRARGYHARHRHGKVIYLCDEFAFWGGIQCMDGQHFIEEIAEQSHGAIVGCFTTPYGKRGGAWWAFNHPDWRQFTFPTWMNPVFDKRKLAQKVKRLLEMGRGIVVEQEIRGQFVDDAGLFFPLEIWLRSINASLEWQFGDQDNYRQVLRQLIEMAQRNEQVRGHFLLGLDPNSGSKKAGADPFGISLVEKVGRKYYNRFTAAFNGRSHDEIIKVLKLICRMFMPRKINWDGGGGYHSGPMAMLKGSPGAQHMVDIPESNKSIVGYMSLLRSLMAMGRFEQPPSDSLKDSQMAMQSIGDTGDDYGATDAVIKFQTTGKKSGIPCDLAALGLALSRERISRDMVLSGSTVSAEKGMPKKAIETARVHRSIDRLGNLGLKGIDPRLTKVGI